MSGKFPGIKYTKVRNLENCFDTKKSKKSPRMGIVDFMHFSLSLFVAGGFFDRMKEGVAREPVKTKWE